MHLSAAVLFVSALAFSPLLFAAQWERISSSDEYILYADTRSMSKSKHRARAWMKRVYVQESTTKQTPSAGRVILVMELMTFDCADRAYLALETIEYIDEVATKVGTSRKNIDFRPDYSNARPDSIGEVMLEFVCSRAPEKSK